MPMVLDAEGSKLVPSVHAVEMKFAQPKLTHNAKKIKLTLTLAER